MAPSTPKKKTAPVKNSGSGIKKTSRVPHAASVDDSAAFIQFTTPSNVTTMEKNMIWLWAFYKTTPNVTPRHDDIAQFLGITNRGSRNRFSTLKTFMGSMQSRAEKDAPPTEKKNVKKEEGDEADENEIQSVIKDENAEDENMEDKT